MEPDERLGAGWKKSNDRAVTLAGDASGLHVLVADRDEAYRWRVAVTLAEPGLETDKWIGQHCLTGSGSRAVVVYAPRQLSNREHLMRGGAFAAVVDLATGSVTKLPFGVSLAYHNPGCGAGETAVLSRLESTGQGPARTWLGSVDTARPARLAAQTRATGHVTAVVPVRGGLLGVKQGSLVSIAPDGQTTVAARVDGTPHRLMADGIDGVALQVLRGPTVRFARYADGKLVEHGGAPTGTVRLRAGAGGRVYAVGFKARERVGGRLPAGWTVADSSPESDVSTTGALFVTRAVAGREVKRVRSGQVSVSAKLATGGEFDFSVAPDAGPPDAAAPGTAPQSADDPGSVPYDPDRACAVPRNDPTIQVYQPDARQAEWAADLAVRGQLTFQRPANWLNNGMPAYAPQGLFPSLPLAGGGNVPAQVLLGVLAQESNMMQASFHAVDGSAGNPLTSSGFYGIRASGSLDPRQIGTATPDCGYGAGQVTTGMRAADTNQWLVGVQWDYNKQKAVALDYATNIAAALRILQDKWNTTRSAGLIANNGDPRYIENWWFALWAYNTGFYPQDQAGNNAGAWGVGWSNNPANPDYPADRQRFLKEPLDVPAKDGHPAYDDIIGYDNAKHPHHWSYPERVIGFAYESLRRYNYTLETWTTTFLPAAGPNPDAAQPGRFTFCSTQVNECDPEGQHIPAPPYDPEPGPCLRDDLRCWWHAPVAWQPSCVDVCGWENRRYTQVEPRPLATNIYPTPKNSDGTCKVTMTAQPIRVIDDITTTSALGPEGCRPSYQRGGTFSLRFGSMTRNGATYYPSKVDFHQIGGGFGGHFWFAHTMTPTENDRSNDDLKVTGTWNINPTDAWTRVLVHIPDHGAHTRQAEYKIYLPGQSTPTKHRIIPTRWEANTWVDLGVFDFRAAGTPRVELSNFTRDGRHVDDVAWDALAVQPLAEKPRHFVVSLGDSYSSGEGAGSYTRVSDQYGDEGGSNGRRNSCRRGANAWAPRITLGNAPAGLGPLAASRDPRLDFHVLACAGARTHHLMKTTTVDGSAAPPNAAGKRPEGQYHEVSQLDAGFLDENTTLVTFTIGGNDADWGDILNKCAVELDCRRHRQTIQNRIDLYVKWDVQRTIDEVRTLAPNADIVLVGYPYLLRRGVGFVSNVLPGFPWDINAEESEFLAEMADYLTAALMATGDVRDRKSFVDVRSRFFGHEAGAPANAYLNGIVLPDIVIDDDGDPKQLTSMESFHPNVDGYAAYAAAVSEHVTALGHSWL
ncbi:SGNH/GDSL hydrolase family protein [Micromonospora sp. CPCC 205371]|nr:SGNH/GDSL hydrolase family protein [Micromonospora sp. CPCC 205371]